MEKGNVFGEGTRTPVAISIFVKNPDKRGNCELYYHDIGNYLDRDEKLALIARFQSMNGLNRENKWEEIRPNPSHDWINQRDPAFESFALLGNKEEGRHVVFEDYSSGVKTNRDPWCYNFSRAALIDNMTRMIIFYNQQVEEFSKASIGKSKTQISELVESFVDTDPKKISWTRELKEDLSRLKPGVFQESALQDSLYRPFIKQHLYFDRQFNNCVYQLPRIFPDSQENNLVIVVTGVGATKSFSALMANCIPNFHMHDTSQCFSLYLYEKEDTTQCQLILTAQGGELQSHIKRSAITDAILADFRAIYEPQIMKEDIFYYVYGVLHSPEYRTRFASDLKKMLPRLPFTRETSDFWRFSRSGRDLAQWHLNYESVEPWPVQEVTKGLFLDPSKDFLVQKMTFGRATIEQKAKGEKVDKTTICYNAQITLIDIPLEAYDYVVNGKPAIEWIMERYQITVDKDSGIRNDPNDWAREREQPRYILDLLKRIIRVSMETMRIVNALPPLNERCAD